MDANTIIERLGGTGATAKFFHIEPASVSGWRKNGIPKLRLELLQLRRPDLFIEPVTSKQSATA